MLLALPGGVIADVFDRRWLLVGVQSYFFTVSLLLAALTWLNLMPPLLLLAFTFAIGVGHNAGPRLHGTPASIDVPGSAMHAPKGRARVEGSTIVLNALDADGVGLIVAPVAAFDADEYSRVTWRVASAGARGTALLMGWRTREQPAPTPVIG